ncbi:MAG: hypothetical protein AB7P05_08240 [Hyphomonadaceae bacterium]
MLDSGTKSSTDDRKRHDTAGDGANQSDRQWAHSFFNTFATRERHRGKHSKYGAENEEEVEQRQHKPPDIRAVPAQCLRQDTLRWIAPILDEVDYGAEKPRVFVVSRNQTNRGQQCEKSRRPHGRARYQPHLARAR